MGKTKTETEVVKINNTAETVGAIHDQICDIYSFIAAITDDAPFDVLEMLKAVKDMACDGIETITDAQINDPDFEKMFDVYCDGYRKAYVEAHPEKYLHWDDDNDCGSPFCDGDCDSCCENDDSPSPF